MRKIKNELTNEHSGAVAFEYVIILAIMAVAIFATWNLLSGALKAKGQDIANFIQNNGQNALGTSGAAASGP